MFDEYIPKEEVALHSYEDAMTMMKILVENNYCVMLSREENLWILNWVWSSNGANRNDMIFASRDNYECDWFNFLHNHPEIKWEDNEE
jgi:hypothetical protein